MVSNLVVQSGREGFRIRGAFLDLAEAVFTLGDLPNVRVDGDGRGLVEGHEELGCWGGRMKGL